ncbi:MAG TPA: SPOR domain-containing protein [Chitinophagaceae bacterium]|nr:SPOR domain-containing protein [Chitinophagaceae bacterium]
MVKLIVMMAVTLCSIHCFAAGTTADTIVVHKDTRLDTLSVKQAEINSSALRLTPDGHYKGFRLLIVTTRSRDEATRAREVVLQNFPDEKAYLSYLSPYFRVKAGNFTSREDAENFKNELAKVYNGGIYVVQDIIEYVPAAPADVTQ